MDIYGKSVIVFPFASLSILAALISWYTLPETMGRDLSETIEEMENFEVKENYSSKKTEKLYLIKIFILQSYKIIKHSWMRKDLWR